MSDVTKAIAAEGGMTELYQAARRRYDYSDYLKREKFEISDEQRGEFLKAATFQLQMLHGEQVRGGEYDVAVQTRALLKMLLDDLGALVAEMKDAE